MIAGSQGSLPRHQHLFDILDSLPLGVIAWADTGKPMFVNQTLSDLLKWPIKSLLEMPEAKLLQLFATENEGVNLFSECIKGNPISPRAELIDRDGVSIPVQVNCFPLLNKQGRVTGVIALIRDLRQEIVWERSFQEYQYILDSVKMAVISIDAAGIITTCNSVLAAYLGSSTQEIMGKHYSAAFAPFSQRGGFLARALKGETVSIPDFSIETVDGKQYIISVDTAPLLDSRGRVNGAVGIFRDKSKQRMMETKVSRIEQLNIVGELAAGIAHEIRNPLTSIRGFAQMLGSRFTPGAPEQDYLKIMLEELDRANDIIRKFLLLAKPQHPKLQFQDLNHLLDDLLKLVEGQSLLAEVELSRDLDPDVPLMVMETESIKQLFLNLMQNAILAMPSGGKLTVASKFLAAENTVAVQIRDTGIGMPQEVIDSLGKPFFTTRQSGTGLGLTVSYRIVENHKGKIEVDSTVNSGTTFTVKLPVLG